MNIERLTGSGLYSPGRIRTAVAGESSEAGPNARARAASVTNPDGQSLLDIRDQLKDAVVSALQGADGGGDLRATIEGAIRSTLEENGFDPSAVQNAFQGAGFGTQAQGLGGASQGDREEGLVQSFLERLRPGTNLDQLI
ncbi:MAG: hypothetical protein AAFZ65_19275 [Planctomycetota bacterium]